MDETAQNNEQNLESVRPKRRLRTGRLAALLIIIIAGVLVYSFYAYDFSFNSITGDSVAAVVNGQEISLAELNAQYEKIPESYRMFVTKDSILDQMITEKLLLEAASKDQITVSSSEIDAELESMVEQSSQTAEEFEKSLEAQGLTLEEVRNYIEKQLIITKHLNLTLLSQLDVLDSEIESDFKNNGERYEAKKGQARARHILVETEEEALDIKAKLDSGEDFADLAKKYSIGPTAVKGGELGFFFPDDMVMQFSDAVFALDINEISEPVKTQFGWHIIQREPRVYNLDEVREQIREELLYSKQKTALELYVKQLQNNADIKVLLDESGSGNSLVVDSGKDQPDAAETDFAQESSENLADDIKTCYENYALESSTVIFFYVDSNNCKQCQEMLPVVEELKDDGYDIYYADFADKSTLKVVDACYSDVVEGKAPLFICAGSKETLLGKYSRSNLIEFINDCE